MATQVIKAQESDENGRPAMSYTAIGMGRVTNAARALLRHPGLWPEAVRSMFALAPRRWWTRPPFLPLPDRQYLQWRIGTAYGTTEADLTGEDLVGYLRWRRSRRVMT